MLAILGMGAHTPLGAGTEALFDGLCAGRSAFGSARTLDAAGLAWCRAAEVDAPPELEGRALDFARRAGIEALADCPAGLRGDVAVIVASTKGELRGSLGVADGTRSPDALNRSLLYTLAPRLAAELSLGGPVFTVSVACASGLSAVGQARALIQARRARAVLVVGVDILSDFIFRGFLSLRALDPEGARPFDAGRCGLSVGEGAAAVLLGPREGRAYLGISGYAASSDAHHITGPARDGRGLADAISGALLSADLPPEAVGFGVAHGTGTQFNDAMEGIAYRTVLGRHRIPVTAIKGAVGHMMGAAGVANLVVTARALEARRLPPVVGLRDRDPDIDLDLPPPEGIRTSAEAALTSASGFSGVNSAVVVDRRDSPGDAPAIREVWLTEAVSFGVDRTAWQARIEPRVARRLDDLCLSALAGAEALFERTGGPDCVAKARCHGVVLGTALGCIESDYAFWVEQRDAGFDRANPRRFAYTLPNIALGEVAIRHRLRGENLVFVAGRASALFALAEAIQRVRAGGWDVALVFGLDAVGAALTKLVGPNTLRPNPVVWLVESAAYAKRRGATPLASGLSGWTGRSETKPLSVQTDDPLGTEGVAMVSEALHQRSECFKVEVRCGSGYAARIEGLAA